MSFYWEEYLIRKGFNSKGTAVCGPCDVPVYMLYLFSNIIAGQSAIVPNYVRYMDVKLPAPVRSRHRCSSVLFMCSSHGQWCTSLLRSHTIHCATHVRMHQAKLQESASRPYSYVPAPAAAATNIT